MIKILHTADWQIGRQYGRFSADDAAVLAEARFSTVERIAELAQREQVRAVLVAGDVFDAQTVSDRTIRRLFNAMRGFAGQWIMIPGNHDAALAESVWTRAQRLSAIPASVHVFLRQEAREFPELGFAVLAAPLTQRQTHEDLTAWFDTAGTAPGLLRLGLAHGSVQGILADDIDSSNPIAADRASRAGLDYLALGDWHGLKRIDDRTWYSGTPEHERFKDNGAGHVLLVELPGGGGPPRVSPRMVTQYEWQSWTESVSVDSDIQILAERLRRLPAATVLELRVGGRLDLAGEHRLKQALSEAQGRCRSIQADFSELRLTPTDDDIAALHVDGYLGEVLTELQARQQGDGGRTARDALAILADLLREHRPAEQQP